MYKKEKASKEGNGDGKGEGEVANAPSLVIMPPHIVQRVEFLKIQVYHAERLPPMDKSMLGGSVKIDAQVEVNFAGNPPCRTKVVTSKLKVAGRSGEYYKLDPTFYEELWLPVMVPSMADHFTITVMDRDPGIVNTRELVGTWGREEERGGERDNMLCVCVCCCPVCCMLCAVCCVVLHANTGITLLPPLPPLHHYTITPLHHYTTTPLHHYTTTPLHHYTTRYVLRHMVKGVPPPARRTAHMDQPIRGPEDVRRGGRREEEDER